MALVDDRVDCDCSLTDLTVADDKLTLTASDRYHCVDRLDTGLERLGHGLTENHAGSLTLERQIDTVADDRSFAIDRLATSTDL